MSPVFAFASLFPLIPIFGGLSYGGWWALAAMLSVTALVMTLDGLVHWVLPTADPDAEFPAGDALSVVIGLAQLILIPFAVMALSNGHLSGLASAATFYAAAMWIGQVGNSNAHELIHRAARPLRRLGVTLLISTLYGHHASAHTKVHHTWVATPNDPATARYGESYYRFVRRHWIGSFRAGHAAERTLLQKRYGDDWKRHDPYRVYVGGALFCMALALIFVGVLGLIWYVGLALATQAQFMLSDYVQHYGLTRSERAPGKYEPVSPAHSWDAPHWYSGAMMLNAPRHAAHHATPARPYPALDLPQDAPRLPHSLPIMAALAMSPTLWKRKMDHRVRKLNQPGAVA
ncbi:alkane 1-monooxygenase [Palleronia caenipelagi]|uniref:Alkane 1-monooxygenase n=1 Tax=Palleronia caenipelagi TaxID=2489174 RepID=A0A547Q5R7_9RHOB|nr:alkane 1-monooxygenase [Palleronia caenipelagi]TRD21713.1 alkane 1-monooxygenase [Palleronia caenipelagi]